ncbi:MAG: hypothetical protein ACUVV6_08335 [Thermoplasmatota archaeon]
MALREISLYEAKRFAEKKRLKPGRVKGTTRIQFTSGRNPRIEVVNWGLFETYLRRRGLSIFEERGFLKLMKSR